MEPVVVRVGAEEMKAHAVAKRRTARKSSTDAMDQPLAGVLAGCQSARHGLKLGWR
jgi:hypothetical protein